MNKQNFFRCADTVIHTVENLKTFITSQLPDLQDDYILEDVILGTSSNVLFGGVVHFPMVFILLTDRERPECKDTALYIPETDQMLVLVGRYSIVPLEKKDVGRKFKISFDDGFSYGTVMQKDNGEFYFTYHK